VWSRARRSVPVSVTGQCVQVSSSLPEPELPEDVVAEPLDGPGATITPYRDGPLIVRGDFRLLDQDGAEIDPGRTTIALCRCGKSGIKPFCDGTHKRSGFSAPSAPSRPRPAAQIVRAARQGTRGDGEG
jgi:CDGSH-type Zn-finger protein